MNDNIRQRDEMKLRQMAQIFVFDSTARTASTVFLFRKRESKQRYAYEKLKQIQKVASGEVLTKIDFRIRTCVSCLPQNLTPAVS